MDAIQVFNDELQSLLDTKPPVSKAKMGLITRAAMKGVKFYKHIVQSVEKFISKCRPEYKVPGLYVIDSIVRQSRHQFGIDRDVYAARFARNLQSIFSNLFTGCNADDKPRIVRVLNLWQKNRVFNSQVIQPLLDMANPNSTLALPTESTLSADSPGNMDSSRPGQNSKFSMHQYNNQPNNNSLHTRNSSSSAKQHRSSDGGLRFSKNMLDFDYDEDDDDDGDETPTEAEPPLSSTLNKIEKEHRGRNEKPASSHQSSQQYHHHSSNRQDQSPNARANDPDPVLERWNRLLKQQSITSENPHEHSSSEGRSQRKRSRSRSPPAHEKQVDQKLREQPPPPPPVPSIPRPKSPETISSAERDAERQVERARKCLPEIRDKHLTVCSSTLWLGHVPKTVSEADISDAFGEFGAITSIDLIPPRGCAYVCMDRRQDAKEALSKSRDLKLNGSHIRMAWAPGKGFKEYKKFKDYWEVQTGCSYIPYTKIDESIDFDILEEGGVIDEDSMSMEMRERRERKARELENSKTLPSGLSLPLPALPILTQPPPFTLPQPNLTIPPPTSLGQGAGIGGIPFPPPGVASTSGQISVPPPTTSTQNIFDSQDSQDHTSMDGLGSPATIDQQLSMTERQINMVEQQLSMIQHAQKLAQPPPVSMAGMHTSAIFPQTQPNPMIFDLSQGQLIHGGGASLLDPHQQQHMNMYTNAHPLLGQPPPMLPTSQAGMAHNLDGNLMPPYSRY